jgi:hypothetical protein
MRRNTLVNVCIRDYEMVDIEPVYLNSVVKLIQKEGSKGGTSFLSCIGYSLEVLQVMTFQVSKSYGAILWLIVINRVQIRFAF